MTVIIRLGTPADEAACNALAKRSPYTRDFANPPLSLKAMRKVAFTEHQVYVAELDGKVVGFLWSRPMKPKHMAFCNAYYSAVDTAAVGGLGSVNRRFLMRALEDSPFKAVEFVCEHGNAPTHEYYTRAAEVARFFGRGTRLRAIKQGTVGKDARPYTRWRLDYEQE